MTKLSIAKIAVFTFFFAAIVSFNSFAQDKPEEVKKETKKACCSTDADGKDAKCSMDKKEMKSEDHAEKHEMHKDKMKEGKENHSKSEEMSDAKPFNKLCPVKGGEIDGKTPPVEYNGKLYGFCCPGCDSKFQKDPEKYIGNLNEDGTRFLK